MKKIIYGFVIVLILCSSCNGNKKKGTNPQTTLSQLIDSTSEVQDSLDYDTILAKPKATRSDGTFDDFLYSFANYKKVQLQRTKFPLLFINNNRTSRIQKRFWKFDRLYYSKPYYTMIFDRESDMTIGQHSNIKKAQFEWIYLKTNKIQEYNFKRMNGAWILESINLHDIQPCDNENFFDFFYKFANDSVFQRSRIHNPITYVTNDPDDDFAILTTTMDISQWMAWNVFLPKDALSNVNYGQSNRSNSNVKILSIKGKDNGMSNTLFFRRIGTNWQFYKYEDISN